MIKAVALAVALIAAPIGVADASSNPPHTIRVFISHKRGSSVPAHIDRVPLKLYVARVMASGAWPARKPWASLLVGAQAIKQYAWWHIKHHQPGYSWRGRRYDIRDGDQYYKANAHVRHRLISAVHVIWPIRLTKRDRFFRTGWRGNGGSCGQVIDGWHLYEDGITDCAKKGWRWTRILRLYLRPVAIHR